MCKKFGKRCLCFLLVSVLAFSSLWAFPGRGRSAEPVISQEEQETLTDIVAPVLPVAELPVTPAEPTDLKVKVEVEPPVLPLPETEPSKISEEDLRVLNELRMTLEEASKRDSSELMRLIRELEAIRADYEIVKLDIGNKDAIIDELTTLNASQADELAYLRGAYDALLDHDEPLVKPYALAGMTLGFVGDKVPTYGVNAQIGLQTKHGFMFEVGGNYTIGSIDQPVFVPSLNNGSLSFSMGYGW